MIVLSALSAATTMASLTAPKSTRYRPPAAAWMMFAGLMSRWITAGTRPWRYSRIASTSSTTATTSASENRPFASSSWARVRPAMKSSTR